MDPETTENLTRAVAAWVSMAARQLVGEAVAVLQACLHGTGTDLRVSVSLKGGKILLEGTNEEAGQCVEFFREDVEPLRPADNFFGHHGEGGWH
jgi:hypothetical protein